MTIHPVLGLVAAYVSGSFPSAYLAGRLLKGIDLRKVGSGNLGATNVFRSLGVPAAVAVFLFDAAKGWAPVFFLPRLLVAGPSDADPAVWWGLAYGVAAILGHSKSVFLLWHGGGKGVSTAFGVFAALVPLPAFVAIACFGAVLWGSGYMSIASLTGAFVFPLFVWIDRGFSPVFWVGAGVAVFIVWTHRTNIRRLRDGTEGRVLRGREHVP